MENMKAIPVSLKEDYVDYIGHKVRTEASYKYKAVEDQVTAAMAGTEPDPERIITVEVDPEMLYNLMEELGILSEKYTGGLHMEIKEAMTASITATATAEMQKPEGERDIELLQSIQFFNTIKMLPREQDIEAWRAARKLEGRKYWRNLPQDE